MNWAKNVFVRNAELYEMVLEGMWEKGEEDALAISGLLQQKGMDGCRVLDVPCGIGRVGVPLAQLGFRVTGLDYSPRLIRAAASKAVRYKVEENATFRNGEMSDLKEAFPKDSFDCAINVFTSIGYGTEEDDIAFFKGLREVVRTEGLLVISGLRNRDYIAAHPAQNVYEESKNLLVLDRYSFDIARSRERGVWRFYLRVKDAMKFAGEFPIDIRLYSPHELVSMLRDCGWSVSKICESITTMRDFTTESPVYALVAEAV